MKRAMIFASAYVVVLASCSMAAKPSAVSPAGQTDAAIKMDGAMLYRRQCAICHAAGGFGSNMLARRLGPDKAILDQRGDLNPAYVRIVVRSGLGDMPPLSRVELPDAELEAVAQYLTAKVAGGAR